MFFSDFLLRKKPPKSVVCRFWLLCCFWGLALSLKQIAVAQRFLRGVVALGSASAIREKQWRGVSKALEKLSVLTPAQAAEWLAAFDAELWTAAQVTEYQEAVAAKTKLEEQSCRGTGI